MIVVPVFMNSCHVSLKLKIGPLSAQITIIRQQAAKVLELPVNLAVRLANLEKVNFT